ncbi:MAG: DUF1698 domain-containing protein [Arsenophonus sp. ER-QC15-MAG3]
MSKNAKNMVRKCGFFDVNIIDQTITTIEEQRKTD